MRSRLVLGAFVVALAALPLIPAIPEFWITLLNYIGLYSIVTFGLVLLTGVAGLTSFGQAAFVGIGAYATAVLTTVYGVSPWLTLPVALVLSGLAAWLIGAITLRLSGHYLSLSTLAWGISLYYLFGNIEWLGQHNGLNGLPPLRIGGHPVSSGREYYAIIWIVVLIVAWGMVNLLDSRPGRAIRALKGGTLVAEAFGINTARMKIVVFVIAAMLAGLSGWLYAHLQRAVSPGPFDIDAGIEYLFMAVVGGSGHVWGAVLGAGVLTIIQNILQDVLPRLLGTSGDFQLIVFGILLVVLLQTMRDGLWPFLRRLVPPGSGPRAAADAAPPLPRRPMPPPDTPLLQVTAARKEFGGLIAVNDISFDVRAGEIVGLIGPNGAGKSTTFNLITGVAPVTAGEVRFAGARIDGLPVRRIARLGIGRTFQHVRLLPGMSVLENVAIGASLRAPSGLRGGVLGAILRLDRAVERQLLHEAAGQLQRVGLGAEMHLLAGNLALGQQRILEIARALCLSPVLLLLDEPAAGLRHKEKQALADLLRRLRAEGVTILLVEHDMDFVMGVTDRLVVMDFGTKLAEGIPAEIQANPVVLEAYLGGVE
ncbi:MAG TPA: branched-chain amino acid ABC transporter ATP-binding protein/permease [Stellaceae bacterium]|nr:branched-chain amino acid ABC transporter ATP-binding protein/permease [Stellaceae bacterium]